MTSAHEAFAQLVSGLRGTVPADVDWVAVLGLANRSLVTPSLWHALHEDAAVSQDARSLMQEIGFRSGQRNDALRVTLEEALVCLNTAGIIPVLLKGTGFLVEEDEEARHRILSDLDLLLPEESIQLAVKKLNSLGFVYQTEEPNAWDVHALGRPQDPGMIDLHVRVKIARPLLDHARLSENARVVQVGKGTALLPAPEMQALVFILHDQIQEYDYARGLIDIRHLRDLQLIDRLHSPDWSALPQLAEGKHGRNAVKVQLRSLAQLLGVAIGKPASGGVWPSIQYRRRLVQLRFPALAPLFTALTLAIDPPLNPENRQTTSLGAKHERKRFWQISRLVELCREKSLPTKA